MIVSHRKKFIFVKTAKTAGSSLEVFLSRHCGPEDIVTPLSPAEEGHHPRNHDGLFNPLPEIMASRFRSWPETKRGLALRSPFYSHLPARIARCRLGDEVWNSYYKFTVERNPWDKTLSHHAMMSALKPGGMTLPEYFNKGKFCHNAPIYTDWDDRTVMVDRFIRYDRLNEDLREVCELLEIPFAGFLTEKSKASYRSDRRHYREVFTPEQADRVRNAFRQEIELHGFEF